MKFFHLITTAVKQRRYTVRSDPAYAMKFSTVSVALFVSEILLLLLLIACDARILNQSLDPSPFPPNFLFGTASSSYQVIV